MSIDKKLLWSNEQLDEVVHLEKYKMMGFWFKLGLNVLELNSLGSEGPKTSLQEALWDVYKIKATVTSEIYSSLKKSDPAVRLRIRDIDNNVEKVQVVRFSHYMNLLEQRTFEFPDIHWWPYNFLTPIDFQSYVKRRIENLDSISYQPV